MKSKFLILLLVCNSLYLSAQYIQLGNKLVGTNATTEPEQGTSVSLSADGKLALVGGKSDDSGHGAVWIYTFNGSNFVQIGDKLVGTGGEGQSGQGYSVCLSADGKTALVGGYTDNSNKGAAWIYTFDGSSFVQVGNKLVGTNAIGNSYQGSSVALSADGKIAVVGGSFDNAQQGAIWVYTFNGSNYEQANKLVGTGTIGDFIYQGASVSISADGTTILVGGPYDNYDKGAVWVYSFNGSNYIQTDKLLGTGVVGAALQGCSVSLSADGKTALIGGNNDDAERGAVWVFTSNGTNFVQAGSKLVGKGSIGGFVNQGSSVSISADGKTALIGGPSDNVQNGATWIFTFNGINFEQAGHKLIGRDTAGSSFQGSSVSLSANGQIALVGGSSDNLDQGAAWVYKLNIQNQTGISDFSSELSAASFFDVFPNPTKGAFSIKFNGSNKGKAINVEVYNNLGQHVCTLSEGVSSLPTGFYLLKSSGYCKKLVVE